VMMMSIEAAMATVARAPMRRVSSREPDELVPSSALFLLAISLPADHDGGPVEARETRD
jgi:hypothetical protein